MDLFQHACGASGPLQLRLEYPGSPGVECRSFDAPFVVIGRDPRSDLVLDHNDICPRHAYLQQVDGRLYCVDLGSRRGILVGGQAQRAGWVEPEQAIRIGPYRLRYVNGEAALERSGSHDALDPSGVTLELRHRGFTESQHPLAGGLSLVGSSTDCPVRLRDPGVSNVHCSLVSTPLGVWVVDLFGKGGITLNGVPVRHARLEPGDQLRIGRSSIQFRTTIAHGESKPPTTASPIAPADHSHRAHRSVMTSPQARLTTSNEADGGEEPETADVPFSSSADYEPEPKTRPPVSPLLSSRQRRIAEEQKLAELSARERRASCRYAANHAEAVMSWWEAIESPAVVLSAPRPEAKAAASDTTIYKRAMACWSGNRNETQSDSAAAELARDSLPPLEESMQSRISASRLLDISQTGLLVLSPVVPPRQGRIWIRLESPQSTDWVEVVVKGAIQEATGEHRIRLAFREACPYDFFKAVLYKKSGS